MIRIRTLGGLSVQGAVKAAGGAVTQPRRLAVLALIARAGERAITRDRVVATLWPDADEDVARKSLSQALYALRRDLGADELVLGVQELKLNLDIATCDVIEFETALAARALDRAVELYGGPFLDGFRLPGASEFDRWVEDERRSLAQRHVEVLERLARKHAERGDAAAAAGWWRKVAELDPLNARIAAEVMRSMAAAGDPGGALKHARIYEALLAQELDLEPDQQVVELARRIRREAAAAPNDEPPVAKADPQPTVAAAASPPAVTPLEPAAPAELPPVAKPRRDSRLVAALAGSIVVLATVGAWAGLRALRTTDPPVMAVGRIVDYRTTGGREAEAVGDMLGTNLARVRGLRVLSGARLYEVVAQLDDAKQPQNTVVARAAQRAGATEVLEGGLHALTDGRLMLELRRIDLKTGAVRDGYRLEGGDVYALVSRATEVLSQSLDHPSGRLDPGDVSTRSLVAYRFYEEGLRSYARSDYRGADRLLEAALAEDSTFAMAAYYRLMARVGMGTWQSEKDPWERVLRLAERAPERERLLIKATWAFMARDMSIEPLADSLATLYPAEVDGPYLQGSGRIIDADFTSGIGYMRRVIEMDSSSLGGGPSRCRACDATAMLIYAYTSIDSLGVAERIARDYVRKQPSARSWLLLADVLLSQDRVEEAIEAHRTAVAINPVNEYDRVFAAVAGIRSGNFDDADRLTRALVREGTAPDDVEARWVLTISLRNQARWREALALTRESIAALPARDRAGEAARGLKTHEAIILQEWGRAREAAVIWDSLVRDPPPGRPAAIATLHVLQFALLADALAAAGDTTQLIVAADSAARSAAEARSRGEERLANHGRGLLLAVRGDTAAAIETLERAIYSPTTGFTRTNRALGALYLARGRPADAVSVLGAALRGSHENRNLYVTRTELHELLARAFDQLGKADSAAVHYEYVASALAHADPEARPRHTASVQRLAALGRVR
jgi:DNA-binding SARP family transcriptional activator